MKGAEFERLARAHLLPALPDYAVRGRLIFHTPIHGLLRGIVWNQPGFARYLASIDVFVQPLYVPKHHLVLSYQGRDGEGYSLLRGDWTIDPADPHPTIDRLRDELRAAATGFLAEMRDESMFAIYLERLHAQRTRPGIDPNLALDWGASLLVAGQIEHALRVLDAAVAHVDTRVDAPEWVYRVAGQCGQLAALAREDRSLAITQLAEWRRGTLDALKLTKWAVPDWP